MKKSSILILVVALTGSLLGNIASLLAIYRIPEFSFNILNLFETSKLSLNILLIILILGLICILIHIALVCYRKVYKHLIFSFSVLIVVLLSAYTLPYTLIRSIEVVYKTQSVGGTNIVCFISSIATVGSYILALLSLGVSILGMRYTNEKPIIINENEFNKENLFIKEEAKETEAEETIEESSIIEKVEEQEINDAKEEKPIEINEEKVETIKDNEFLKEEKIKKEETSTTTKKVVKKTNKSNANKDDKGDYKMAKEVKEKKVETKEKAVKEEKKSAPKAYHLVKRKEDNKWAIKLANGEKVIKLFNTKEEALVYSKELAEKQDASLRVHASKGKSKGKIQKQ